jgi:hypothetical protein
MYANTATASNTLFNRVKVSDFGFRIFSSKGAIYDRV